MRKIIWERWIDPFLENEDEVDYEDTLTYQDIENGVEKFKANRPIAIIASPIVGTVPIMPHAVPSKTFDFWIGHTNFDITPLEKAILEEIEGVETLDIVTRYRFRVSVGKAFKSDEVKSTIQQILYGESDEFDPQIMQKIHDLRQELELKHKFWFILVTPNGNMDYITSEEFSHEFRSKFNIYEETREQVGGLIFKSWPVD